MAGFARTWRAVKLSSDASRDAFFAVPIFALSPEVDFFDQFLHPLGKDQVVDNRVPVADRRLAELIGRVGEQPALAGDTTPGPRSSNPSRGLALRFPVSAHGGCKSDS